ncbi:MAG: glycogen debranching protein GlgX [Bradymonadales bacterium]|jgi:isoamylase
MYRSIGHPLPFGATVSDEGVNFAFYSRNATAAYIDLFRNAEDEMPYRTHVLDSDLHRTGDIWHIFVEGVRAGQLYGIRLDGPYMPRHGHRFNVNKLLADPYSRAYVGRYNVFSDAIYGYDRDSSLRERSFSPYWSAGVTAKSIALKPLSFAWGETARPKHSLEDSVIYECHVKGMTAHPSSLSKLPGTFAGLCDRIPHLKSLGITAIELLPVAQFNEWEPPNLVDPVTGERNRNYWGYATIGFFAPHHSYVSDPDPTQGPREFREMVQRFHEAKIEVILDVVFNHSGEGNEHGPTIAYRGLDNSVYYMLDKNKRYENYTGCGNTMNCNHPVMKQLIIDCLRFWLVEMRVDGFRFDLATILGRSHEGEWISDPQLGLLNDIAADPILRGCKLIAESWDAAGMYKVGRFPVDWAEWNGRFRDDLRRFWRSDNDTVKDLALRIGGSRDLFGTKQNASQSVNFVTAHDGFTLRDLCSYNKKHNERNGEQNRDGSEQNFSDNMGVEGPGDEALERRRKQRAKNLLTTLFISRGTPMILGGDEYWRSQGGNNNAFCQDNPVGWIDWTYNENGEEMLRFMRLLIKLRAKHPALKRTEFADPFVATQTALRTQAGIIWHGVSMGKPDWSAHSHSLACELLAGPREHRFYIAMNAWREPLSFEIPRRTWKSIINTALDSPQDFVDIDEAHSEKGLRITVEADSVRVLMS